MWRKLWLFVLCLVLGTWTGLQICSTLQSARFLSLIMGTAPRPFVYRCLVGLWLRAVNACLPVDAKHALVAWATLPYWNTVLRINHLAAVQMPYVVAFVVTSALCFTGFGLCLFFLGEIFYPEMSFLERLLWISAGFALANATCSWRFYLYDPGTWLLFSLLLLVTFRRDWKWFWPVFILATLNKETSLLVLPIVYQSESDLGVSPDTGSWIRRHRRSVALFIVWLVLDLAIKFAYRHNPGPTYEWHLFDQGLRFTSPSTNAQFAVIMGGMGIFVAYGWKSKPLVPRRAFSWTFVPMCLGMATLGVFMETRAWYEMFPLAYWLAVPAVRDLGLKFWPKRGLVRV